MVYYEHDFSDTEFMPSRNDSNEKFAIPHSTGICGVTWVDKLYNMVNRHTTIPLN